MLSKLHIIVLDLCVYLILRLKSVVLPGICVCACVCVCGRARVCVCVCVRACVCVLYVGCELNALA